MTGPHPKPPTPAPPDGAALHEAALAYLARFAATEATLRRVLVRRIDRWARQAALGSADADALQAERAAAVAAAEAVVRRLGEAGAVDDATFAGARARRLHREGRSRRAIAAHLAARGVGRETADAALVDDELAAALVFARRRRIGPFGSAAPLDADGKRRTLGVLARAGFPRSVASALMGMSRDAAEQMLLAARGA